MPNEEYKPNVKAAFLGPHSENSDILEELIIEALRDHAYWRRNFHPEDPPVITQKDKIDPSFLETTAELRHELFNILSELKRGVPFYSLRYLGHINSDLLIASIVGYFGAMLYNQNNVVAESSPVTIKKELEYINALARMIGFNKVEKKVLESNDDPGKSSWGHLSSGGTTANLEAMWVARNVKFYPLSILLAASVSSDENIKSLKKVEIILPNKKSAAIGDLPPFQLLSLTPADSLDLRRKVRDFLKQEYNDKDGKEFNIFEDNLPSIRNMGLLEFYRQCKSNNLDFELPVIFVPRSRHYCWPKLADVLGLGQDCLKDIELDDNFRLDIEQLNQQIEKLTKRQTSVLCVMSVCGTTEEGAIDPAHEIVTLRGEYEQIKNISFWLHSDAAYGGFFASVVSAESTEKFAGIVALKDFDSLVIDPHKLGYVPYPAGAVLYRDARVREHITFEAPYLSDNADVTKAFWGKWTLEGSRPGAAAISCYLAQHCFPLNESGYGIILQKCLDATNHLSKAFDRISKTKPDENYGFVIKKLYEPDLNVLCYVVTSPKYIKDPVFLNELTEKIWNNMTVTGEHHASHYQYIVSKTDYPFKDYENHVRRFLKDCDIKSEPEQNYKLVVLRTVLMHPLAQENLDQLDEFAKYLCSTAYRVLPEVQIDMIKNRFANREDQRRMRVLIVEDMQNESDTLKRNLELEFEVSSGLEIVVASSQDGAMELFKKFPPDAMVVDLNLSNSPGDFQGIELLEWLVNKQKYKNSIVYSAYLDENARKALERLGITEESRISRAKFERDIEKKRKEESRDVLYALLSLI